MAVVKYDTMINLMPDLWLTKMQEDLDEDDDVDDYGRLVIDIPDTPDIEDGTTDEQTEPNINGYKNTEFRDDQPTPVSVIKTSNSTQKISKPTESKPQKVSPLRRNRDFPIKLLLKRSFQNSSNKPHKKRLQDYNAENEKKKLNKYNNTDKNILLTLDHNQNQIETQEIINITSNDVNERVSPLNFTNETATVSFKKPHYLNQSIESHREELLSTLKHYSDQEQEIINRSRALSEEVDRRSTPLDYVKNTPNAVSPKKEKIGSLKRFKEKEPSALYKHKLKQSKTNYTIEADNFSQRNYQNHIKKATSFVNSRKQNIVNYSIKNYKKELISTKPYLKNVEPIIRPHTAADNVNSKDYLRTSMNTTNTSPEKQDAQNDFVKNQDEQLSKWNLNTHYSIPVETLKSIEKAHTVDDEQRISPPNNKGNNEKNTNFAPLHSSISSHSYQRPRENRQRISVVSNEFLFRHRSKRETLGRTGTNSRFRTNNDQRSCPQLYQEALIEFMERQYQLALRENIPLTVNRQPLQPESLQELPDTRLIEVIQIDQKTSSQDFIKNTSPSKQESPNVANQNHHVSPNHDISKNTPIPEQNLINPDNQSGYNILVHRGPDVNRIVITLANESEETNETTHQSFNGDQRVPESTIITSPPAASPPSQMKRSYYYKEPSLRSFRRRLPQKRAQKQSRNTVEQNRFDPSDHPIDNHTNAAYAQHYSFIGNHYDFPTPVLENYYNLNAQNYLTPAFVPWELNDRRAIATERITRRSINTKSNIPSSQKPCYLEPYEQQILFGPLNLSLKPLAANERPYPEMCPKCPMSVQGYY